MRQPTVVAEDIYAIAESACDAGYHVRLEMTDGQSLAGQAVQIQSTDEADFLRMRAPGRTLLVRLRAVTAIGLEAVA